MNKKVITGVVAAAALSTAMIGATNAHAETGTNSMKTGGSISFEKDNTSNDGLFTGNLVFAYVPKEFNFGSHEVSSTLTSATYSQVREKDSDPQYVSVSDDRSDKKNGWAVKATLDDFENEVTDANGEKKTTKLANAELRFDLGTAQKYAIDTKLSDTNKQPTPGITTQGSLSAMSATELGYYAGSPTQVTLVAGSTEEVQVVDYATQAQSPTSTLAVAKEVTGVQLKVLDHSQVQDKKFTSKVNWTLAEDPAI